MHTYKAAIYVHPYTSNFEIEPGYVGSAEQVRVHCWPCWLPMYICIWRNMKWHISMYIRMWTCTVRVVCLPIDLHNIYFVVCVQAIVYSAQAQWWFACGTQKWAITSCVSRSREWIGHTNCGFNVFDCVGTCGCLLFVSRFNPTVGSWSVLIVYIFLYVPN